MWVRARHVCWTPALPTRKRHAASKTRRREASGPDFRHFCAFRPGVAPCLRSVSASEFARCGFRCAAAGPVPTARALESRRPLRPRAARGIEGARCEIHSITRRSRRSREQLESQPQTCVARDETRVTRARRHHPCGAGAATASDDAARQRDDTRTISGSAAARLTWCNRACALGPAGGLQCAPERVILAQPCICSARYVFSEASRR